MARGSLPSVSSMSTGWTNGHRHDCCAAEQCVPPDGRASGRWITSSPRLDKFRAGTTRRKQFNQERTRVDSAVRVLRGALHAAARDKLVFLQKDHMSAFLGKQSRDGRTSRPTAY